MIDLDGPRGLGDAIHLRALVLHLLGAGDEVTVFTPWPDVFSGLAIVVKGIKERTGAEDIHHCSACLHCRLTEVRGRLTTMFEMACRQAGVFEPVPLAIDWVVRNNNLVERIKRRAAGRKVFVYQPPRITNGLEQEVMRPNAEAFVRYIDQHSDCYRIKVGRSDAVEVFGDAPCELNLFDKTSVHDAFDVVSVADMVFSPPSYLTILAQAMDRPYTCMFTRRAALSQFSRAKNLTPEVLFHKPAIGTAVYDA